MTTLDNVLDLRVVLSVYSNRVELLRLECDRLPWFLLPGASAGLPLHAIVASHFLPALNDGAVSLETIRVTVRQAIFQLRNHLEREFSIFCGTRLHLRFEEQKKDALGILSERLGIENGSDFVEAMVSSGELASVESKSVTEISRYKAKVITKNNFRIRNPEIQALPGKEFSFVLTSKEPVICREIRLHCDSEEILHDNTPVQFDAASSRTVRLPGIPVGMYQYLHGNKFGELTVSLLLEGRDNPITLEQRLRHQPIVLDRPPVALFLDVGSAFSKFLVVELAADPGDTTTTQPKLTARLRTALETALHESPEHVDLDPPEPTQAFVDTHGLSHTPKKELDQYGNEELAAHFSRSISALARRFYQQENRLVTDVFWAFPDTTGRVFFQLTESVNRMLGGAILGQARVVAEAECLRFEFRSVLSALAEAAKDATSHETTVLEKNEEIDAAMKKMRAAFEAYQSGPGTRRRGPLLLSRGLPTQTRVNYHVSSLPPCRNGSASFRGSIVTLSYRIFSCSTPVAIRLDVYGEFSGESEKWFRKVSLREVHGSTPNSSNVCVKKTPVDLTRNTRPGRSVRNVISVRTRQNRKRIRFTTCAARPHGASTEPR